ncbi:MAG: PQQ-dependent sugar dehydrogenase [Pseudomonadota bacterium]
MENENGMLELGFEPFVTLPATAPDQPFARIQEVVPVPGTADTLAVLDTRGVVWLVEGGVVQPGPFIDLSEGALGFVEPGPESGLRSIAFHPGYADPASAGFGKVYLAFSASPESAAPGTRLFQSGEGALFHDVVAELSTAGPASSIADLEGARELLRIEQPFTNHNIGQLLFEPDLAPGDPGYGLLFIGVGDGGGGNDPLEAAGDLAEIYGKVLRIDPLGGPPYGVPADNPFIGVEGALGEVWAFGFRNPQQLAFDQTRLFTGDIGQDAREEIDVVLPGRHYGWDEREGTLITGEGSPNRGPAQGTSPEFEFPVAEYDHSDITAGNAAIAGGPVYRGDAIPDASDTLIFANFPTGDLFYLPISTVDAALADGQVRAEETATPRLIQLVDDDGAATSFAEVSGNASGRVDLRLALDGAGDLLAFSKQSGTIFRLTAPPDAFGRGLTDEEAEEIVLLYEAAFDRDGAIDLSGLNFWIDVREAGVDIRLIAEAFLASAEFGLRAGGPLDDGAFVSLLYDHALERAPDTPGFAFWTEVLARPGVERVDLLLAFADAATHEPPLAYVATLEESAPGFWDFTG